MAAATHTKTDDVTKLHRLHAKIGEAKKVRDRANDKIVALMDTGAPEDELDKARAKALRAQDALQDAFLAWQRAWIALGRPLDY